MNWKKRDKGKDLHIGARALGIGTGAVIGFFLGWVISTAGRRLGPVMGSPPPDQPGYVHPPDRDQKNLDSLTLSQPEEHLVVDMIANTLTNPNEVKWSIKAFEQKPYTLNFKVKGKSEWIPAEEYLKLGETIRTEDLDAFEVVFPHPAKTVRMKIIAVQSSTNENHGFRACAYYPIDQEDRLVPGEAIRISCGGFEKTHIVYHKGSILSVLFNRWPIFPSVSPALLFYDAIIGSDGNHGKIDEIPGLDKKNMKLIVTGHSFGAHTAVGIHDRALRRGIESKALLIDSPHITQAIDEYEPRKDFLDNITQLRVIPTTAARRVGEDLKKPFNEGTHGFYIMMPEIDPSSEPLLWRHMGGEVNHHYASIAKQVMTCEHTIVPALAVERMQNRSGGQGISP